MKRMINLIIVTLALSLMFAMIPTAKAATTGSITVQNAKTQETYSLYRMFVLRSYNSEAGAYLYTATTDWSDFVAQDDIQDIYLEKTASGYLFWVDGADPADFAQLAMAYAEENNITPTASATLELDEEGELSISSSGEVAAELNSFGLYALTFTSLPLGYYLMDSTAGVLCSLDTASPSVTIYEKNTGLPYLDKSVKEDSTWLFSDYNTVDIGQVMEFQTMITANAGAENYVLHDTMSSGLTFSGADSLSVQWTDGSGTSYSTQPELDTDYTINTSPEDGCTFELTFAQSFCDQLSNYDQLIVTYTGYLNGDAVIGGGGNTNTATLTYGNDPINSKTDSTRTYTGEIYIYKYTDSNGTEIPLAGVGFLLGNEDGEWYHQDTTTGLVSWVGNNSQGTIMTSGEDGLLVFPGVDGESKYTLTEIHTLAGYMPSSTIALEQIISVDSTGTASLSHSVDSPICILNVPGVRLPETGGIGTTIFYCSGTLLIFAGLTFLITSRRKRAD